MAYEFRHDFMANAVDEATLTVTDDDGGPFLRSITYTWMQMHWTQQERNDWFHMYVMGGVPFPAYKARGL